MTDKEKIINELNDCLENQYISFMNEIGDVYAVSEETIRNVLTILEEQDAVEPYMDYDGQDVWRCGKCGNSLMRPSYYESDEDAKNHIRYCSHCGRRIKWDAAD